MKKILRRLLQWNKVACTSAGITKKGRIWESHTPLAKAPVIIKTAVTIKADKGEKWRPPNYPFEIIVKN